MAEQELSQKLRLERRLSRRWRGVERALVSRLARSVLVRGAAPDLAQATVELGAPELLAHYADVGRAFDGSIAGKMPEGAEQTREERAAEAAALAAWRSTRATSQARHVGETNQLDADRSVADARRESDRRALDPLLGAMGAADLAATSAALFDRRLRGRTQGIATLETNAAAEAAKMIEAESLLGLGRGEAGGPTAPTKARKRWDSQSDHRVRPAHLAADGQEVQANDPFVVGGELLMHPGDTSLGASVGNVIHCRCSAEYDAGAIAEQRLQGLTGTSASAEVDGELAPAVTAPRAAAPATRPP